MSIISVDNLSKRYRIGRRGRGWDSGLRHALTDLITRPFHRGNTVEADETEFWALKDVSFEVEEGEVLGIIGRNGAGKSTLLKILSRITWPTSGEARIRGRVASLLEVGTGFHPELTGRENIYLNGSILGMTRAEVKKKFAEIVDFSEIEKFLDTPVKYYSSGMYVRLAFAVAAHLDPEILLVDEVLAVGDAGFQKKCLGKMGEVARLGRTILFISHNMLAITRLCGRTILLNEGQITFDGTLHDAITRHLASGSGCMTHAAWEPDHMPGNEHVRLRFVRLVNVAGEPIDKVKITEKFGLQMGIDVRQTSKVLVPTFQIHTNDGIPAFFTADNNSEWATVPREPGKQICTAWIPGDFLNEGTFFVHAGIATMIPEQGHFFEQNVIMIQAVEDAGQYSRTRGRYAGEIPGIFRPILEWTTKIA